MIRETCKFARLLSLFCNSAAPSDDRIRTFDFRLRSKPHLLFFLSSSLYATGRKPLPRRCQIAMKIISRERNHCLGECGSCQFYISVSQHIIYIKGTVLLHSSHLCNHTNKFFIVHPKEARSMSTSRPSLQAFFPLTLLPTPFDKISSPRLPTIRESLSNVSQY